MQAAFDPVKFRVTPVSAQQAAAVNALLETSSHLAIVARAGCGKTWTILKAVCAYAERYPNAEMVVAAYNAPIAAEVKAKLAALGFNWRQVSAQTAHSLGKSLVDFRFGRPALNEYKVRELIAANEGKSEVCRLHGSAVEDLVGYAKQSAFGFFPNLAIENVGAWAELAEQYGVDDFEDDSGETLRKVIAVAQWIYKRSLEDTTQIDFNDMILFPLIKGIRVKFTKDVVFVDEAQDLSRARQALLRRFVGPNGRMVLVGDDRQAIYAFSGADSEALPRMIKELSATVLPLNVTRRCGKAIVAEAKALVPDFEAHEGNGPGAVLRAEALPRDLADGDAILCRNTAPLIDIAYGLIRERIPCKVEGRKIGDGLISVLRRWKVKTVQAFLERLEGYEAREIAKARAKKDERKEEAVKDKCDTLRLICRVVSAEGDDRIEAAIAYVDNLFGEGVTGCVVLATYHRSKGREWRRVFLMEHNLRCPSKYAKREDQLQQEKNLAYVAITRAIEELRYYNPPNGGFEMETKEAA